MRYAASSQLRILNSYTYDLTSTLQHNLTRPEAFGRIYNDRFAWNYSMIARPFEDMGIQPTRSQWLLPLVHGHVDQASTPFGVSITLPSDYVLQNSISWDA